MVQVFKKIVVSCVNKKLLKLFKFYQKGAITLNQRKKLRTTW